MWQKLVPGLRRPFKKKRGFALILSMIVLVLGALITVPLLSLTGSSLKQGTALEQRNRQLYIADAGIQNAQQNLLLGNPLFPLAKDEIYAYSVPNLSDGLSTAVTVKLSEVVLNTSSTYLVHSVGTVSGGGSTAIDAVVVAYAGDYSYFLNNVFTTKGILGLKNKVGMNGFVQDGGQEFEGNGPDWGLNPNPPPVYYGDTNKLPKVWPTAQYLRTYYRNFVAVGSPHYHPAGWTISSDTTLTADEYVVGPCIIDSDNLDLAGHTIFIDGVATITSAISGTGTIAAIGDISFTPKSYVGDPSHGVFVFSLGMLSFWPSGTFYGWAAGKGGLDAKSGDSPSYNWITPNYDLNFPGLKDNGQSGHGAGLVTITSWKITHQ